MQKKTFTLTLVFFVTLLNAAVAQELTIKSMTAAPMDLSASQYERKDLAGQPCGLVKVQLATMGAKFEGNIVGQTEYKTGEYWVYMEEGAYRLTVKHPNFVPLDINFRDYGISGVTSKATYKLTLLMPSAMPVQMDDGASYLVMTVKPANAMVMVDGNPQPVTDGAMRVRLSYGTHRYQVIAAGYANKEGTVEVAPGRNELAVELLSAMAQISVTCPTVGAQIYVNESLKGNAPWSGQLPAGIHRIEARLSGYRSYSQSVQLKEREQRTVELPELMAQVGSLDVDYQPVNAEVWIDGRQAGKSPDIFRNMLVGSHTVEVRASGYTTKQARITIEEGKTAMLSGSLEKVSATLSPVSSSMTASQMNNLGNDYYYGRNGKEKDYNEAVKWYRKAAEQGNAYGQSNLGFMYQNGYGVTRDYNEAVKWYRKAAEQGNANGQNNLGTMYRDGYDVTQDYNEAVKWYRKAAEQGDADGQVNLGFMYEKGYGVTRDYNEAVKWYRKAAEQGNVYGQYNLGVMYEYGNGVNQDLLQAKYWYQKAADQGYSDAKDKLQNLK